MKVPFVVRIDKLRGTYLILGESTGKLAASTAKNSR